MLCSGCSPLVAIKQKLLFAFQSVIVFTEEGMEAVYTTRAQSACLPPTYCGSSWNSGARTREGFMGHDGFKERAAPSALGTIMRTELQ
jgi:hypothetical protein